MKGLSIASSFSWRMAGIEKESALAESYLSAKAVKFIDNQSH
jgi:hypothetical protein